MTTFWLDAHYSGEREKSDTLELLDGVQCPLLAELAVITSFDSQWVTGSPLILIDDARLFNEAYWDSGKVYSAFDRIEWPTLEQIRSALPGYAVIDNGNDVLECRRM